ncbi:MAG: co-chaperone DjlA [Rudaea sp.]|nr:co-chaperone DjlA [Rudaea sp.]
MSILGKLIGGLIGFLLFRHPFGILIGVAIGHLWDSGAMRPPRPAASATFIAPLFGLAGAIAKSDGRVSEQEIAAVENLMTRMQLTPAQRANAIERFTAGKQDGFPVHLAIADLKAWCHGRRDLAYLLLDMLLDIVYAEGPLVPGKLAIVRQLCWALGVHERELAALAAMKGYAYAARGSGPDSSRQAPHGNAPGKDPYAVLGLERNAGDSEIKRAYRKLISQHHPDKLGDVPEELKRRAEERAREINTAYERIRAERHIK